ncbi:MAG: amidohydrolase family protein [Clostridiales bacterium]|nr:amidohydrolase family protein [Clostridiales bacterium]
MTFETKTLREKALRGEPLDIPIIDMHTHIGPKYSRGYHQYAKYVTLEGQMRMYDLMGIDCCVTRPHGMSDFTSECICAITAEAAALYPGRIYGYISATPFEGIDALKKCIDIYADNPAFVGFKLLGGYNGQYTESVYSYAFDYANERGCPVVCHTWESNPPLSQMAEIASKHPNLSFIIAHLGGGSERTTREAAEYINELDNLYTDTCGSLYNTLSIEDIVEMVGADKILFGTDAVDIDPRLDFGRMAFSMISDGDKKKIFAENYLKILSKSTMGRINL